MESLGSIESLTGRRGLRVVSASLSSTFAGGISFKTSN